MELKDVELRNLFIYGDRAVKRLLWKWRQQHLAFILKLSNELMMQQYWQQLTIRRKFEVRCCFNSCLSERSHPTTSRMVSRCGTTKHSAENNKMFESLTYRIRAKCICRKKDMPALKYNQTSTTRNFRICNRFRQMYHFEHEKLLSKNNTACVATAEASKRSRGSLVMAAVETANSHRRRHSII